MTLKVKGLSRKKQRPVKSLRIYSDGLLLLDIALAQVPVGVLTMHGKTLKYADIDIVEIHLSPKLKLTKIIKEALDE